MNFGKTTFSEGFGVVFEYLCFEEFYKVGFGKEIERSPDVIRINLLSQGVNVVRSAFLKLGYAGVPKKVIMCSSKNY